MLVSGLGILDHVLQSDDGSNTVHVDQLSVGLVVVIAVDIGAGLGPDIDNVVDVVDDGLGGNSRSSNNVAVGVNVNVVGVAGDQVDASLASVDVLNVVDGGELVSLLGGSLAGDLLSDGGVQNNVVGTVVGAELNSIVVSDLGHVDGASHQHVSALDIGLGIEASQLEVSVLINIVNNSVSESDHVLSAVLELVLVQVLVSSLDLFDLVGNVVVDNNVVQNISIVLVDEQLNDIASLQILSEVASVVVLQLGIVQQVSQSVGGAILQGLGSNQGLVSNLKDGSLGGLAVLGVAVLGALAAISINAVGSVGVDQVTADKQLVQQLLALVVVVLGLLGNGDAVAGDGHAGLLVHGDGLGFQSVVDHLSQLAAGQILLDAGVDVLEQVQLRGTLNSSQLPILAELALELEVAQSLHDHQSSGGGGDVGGTAVGGGGSTRGQTVGVQSSNVLVSPGGDVAEGVRAVQLQASQVGHDDGHLVAGDSLVGVEIAVLVAFHDAQDADDANGAIVILGVDVLQNGSAGTHDHHTDHHGGRQNQGQSALQVLHRVFLLNTITYIKVSEESAGMDLPCSICCGSGGKSIRSANLPLPMGEVAERSEVGEGPPSQPALRAVSSPKGGAKFYPFGHTFL